MFNPETVKLAREVQSKLLGIQFFSDSVNIREVVNAIAGISDQDRLLDTVKQDNFPEPSKTNLTKGVSETISEFKAIIAKASIKTDRDAIAYLKVVDDFCDNYASSYKDIQETFDRLKKKLDRDFEDRLDSNLEAALDHPAKKALLKAMDLDRSQAFETGEWGHAFDSLKAQMGKAIGKELKLTLKDSEKFDFDIVATEEELCAIAEYLEDNV